MSDLDGIIQKEALAEINQLLQESEAKAAAVIQEAQTKASAQVAACRKRTEAEVRAAVRRAESAAQLTVSTARIHARGREVALVKEKALGALEEIAAKPNYGEVLSALADEAFQAVKAPEAVVVHPNDRDKLEDWAVHKGIELRTDPGIRVGVRIISSGGKSSVENSLPERLDRAWDMVVSGVVQLLWE
jgi:V/A-type H+-transporting ATPase subunit E